MTSNLLLIFFLVLGGLCLSIAAGFLKDWLRKIFKKPKQIGVAGAILFISGAFVTTFVNSRRAQNNKNVVSSNLNGDTDELDASNSTTYNASCIVPKNHLASIGLKGKVNSIRTMQYKAVLASQQIQKVGIKEYGDMDNNSVIRFNTNGFITEALYYNDTSYKLNRKEVYKYNSNGCPVATEIYIDDKLDWREEMQYDYSKSEISLLRYDNTGNFDGKTKTKMGKFGEEKVYYYEEKETIRNYNSYIYNDRGERTVAFFYDAKDKLLRTDTVKYDYALNSVTYTLDMIGSKTTIVETRDKNNLIIEEYSKSPDFSYKKTYTYEFDKKGNWIKRVEFKNGELESTTERTIEYY